MHIQKSKFSKDRKSLNGGIKLKNKSLKKYAGDEASI